MKPTLLLGIVCMPLCFFAQKGNNLQHMYYLNRLSQKKDSPLSNDRMFLEALEGKEVDRVIKTVRAGRSTSSSTYTFNDFGQVSEVGMSNGSRMQLKYEDTLLIALRTSGKKSSEVNYRYDGGLLVLEERFANERMTSRTIIQYNQLGKVAFSSVQSKKDFSMYYEYNDLGKLKIQRFMKNDKVLRVWNYTCDEKGVERKLETDFCAYNEESADGSYIKYIRKAENGKVLLYAHYYDADSSWQKSICTDEAGQLVSENLKRGQSRDFISYEKGRFKSCYSMERDLKERLIGTSYKTKKGVQSTTRYTYDDAGRLLTEESTYKGKTIREVNYVYE